MTQRQAQRLYETISGRKWRDGCTTSAGLDGSVAAYERGMRLVGRRSPRGEIVRP